MGPKTPMPEQDFFRHPLREQINLKHPLVRLAELINWGRLGVLMSESFVSSKGRAASSPHLIAGLLYLQHAPHSSNELEALEMIQAWRAPVLPGLENHLAGLPPSSWRRRG